MDAGKVVKGDYKGKIVWMLGRKVFITTSLRKKVPLNDETVESYEVINAGDKGTARSMFREGIFGTAAAVNSPNKGILVKVVFKDGKKSLISCDSLVLKSIQVGCF